MANIGLFFGSDTGNTESAAHMIQEKIGEDKIELHDIGQSSKEDIEKYDHLIIGTSTWYDGDLQSDWEDFFDNLDDIDFNDKTVALFGLGDQMAYAEYFVDGIGILHDKIVEKGATIIGQWPTAEFDYLESKAEKDGVFVGLPLDEDNESEMTEERIEKWVEQIKGEFGF